jgi:hypothetical protein
MAELKSLYDAEGYPLDMNNKRLQVGKTYILHPLRNPNPMYTSQEQWDDHQRHNGIGKVVRVLSIEYRIGSERHEAWCEYLDGQNAQVVSGQAAFWLCPTDKCTISGGKRSKKIKKRKSKKKVKVRRLTKF